MFLKKISYNRLRKKNISVSSSVFYARLFEIDAFPWGVFFIRSFNLYKLKFTGNTPMRDLGVSNFKINFLLGHITFTFVPN